MKPSWTRRRFIDASTRASVAAAISGVVWGCAPDSPDSSAATGSTAHSRETLQRFSFLLFPYPELGPEPYERVAAAVESDSGNQILVSQGLALLDESAEQPFMALDEADQLAVLRAIEGDPFFRYMLDTTKSILFNDRTVWAHIGYDASLPLNDIDWLGDT